MIFPPTQNLKPLQTDKPKALCLDTEWKGCLESFLFLTSSFWCGLLYVSCLGLPKTGKPNTEVDVASVDISGVDENFL